MSTEPKILETNGSSFPTHTAAAQERYAQILGNSIQRKLRPSSWSLIIRAKKSIFCMASCRNHADQIIHRLKTVGFANNDLSAIFPDFETSGFGPHKKSKLKHRQEQPPILARTMWWAARRGGFSTVGTLAIPGVGSFIVVGPIIAALNGVGAGGIVGRLSAIGIPKTEAIRYENRIKSSQILISVHTEATEEIDRAREIFKETKAQDICTVGEPSPKDSSGIEYALRPTEAAYSRTRP